MDLSLLSDLLENKKEDEITLSTIIQTYVINLDALRYYKDIFYEITCLFKKHNFEFDNEKYEKNEIIKICRKNKIVSENGILRTIEVNLGKIDDFSTLIGYSSHLHESSYYKYEKLLRDNIKDIIFIVEIDNYVAFTGICRKADFYNDKKVRKIKLSKIFDENWIEEVKKYSEKTGCCSYFTLKK